MDEKEVDAKNLQNLADFNCVFCFYPEGNCDKCYSFEHPNTKIPSPEIQRDQKKNWWEDYWNQLF